MTKSRAPRRARADSKESAVKAMIAGQSVILPPDDVEYDDTTLRIFNEVIAEFANVDWSPHNVRVAFFLASTMREMQYDLAELRSEGSVITNDRGNPVMNPRRTACQGYASQITQMRRTLALHAMAGNRKSSDVGKAGKINKTNQAASPLDEDDEDLLPTAPPPSPIPAPIGRA